jgi:hypothetical protein
LNRLQGWLVLEEFLTMVEPLTVLEEPPQEVQVVQVVLFGWVSDEV